MDIYSAESHVKKLLAYVKEVADAKPHMYEKSRVRFKELALTCNEVVSVIAEILQDEMLQNDNVEFGNTNTSDINAVLDSMQSQLSQLKQFTKYDPKQKILQITISDKKAVFNDYKSTLHGLTESHELATPASKLCAEMLWSWFNVRFMQTVNDSTFRYNIRRFPSWIRDFVILFGYAIHTDSVSNFYTDFNMWIDEIRTTDARNRYAIPYSLYQFNKDPDPQKITLESVILWDVLLDMGLRSLCKADNEFYIEEDCVYELCSTLAPDALDDYVNYVDYPEVLKILDIGGDIDG